MIEKIFLHAPIRLVGRLDEMKKYGKSSPDQDNQYITISTKDVKILTLDWLDLHSIQLTIRGSSISEKLQDLKIVSLGREKGSGVNIKMRHYLGTVAPTTPIWRRPLMGYGTRISIYEKITNEEIDLTGQSSMSGVSREKLPLDQEWCSISILYGPDDDRVLAVSAVRFWHKTAISTFESLCQCPKEFLPTKDWLRTNKLDGEALMIAPPFEYVMGNFAQFIRVAPYLVGYDLMKYIKTIEKFGPNIHAVADIRTMLGFRKTKNLKKKIGATVEKAVGESSRKGLPTTRFALLSGRLFTDIFNERS